ncbi:MAG TPA: hypothetical protein VKB89_26085 [Xanthobacteraceae bacterium]|nr:hypothetical protein [Xanthobacteraceae bacterium]
MAIRLKQVFELVQLSFIHTRMVRPVKVPLMPASAIWPVVPFNARLADIRSWMHRANSPPHPMRMARNRHGQRSPPALTEQT